MTRLINEGLAHLLMRASAATRDMYLTRPRPEYQRRQETYTYEVNEVGWPSNVTSSVRATSDTSPLDWRAVIGAIKGKSTTYALYITDVPILQELVDYVSTSEELVSRISPTSAYAKDAERKKEVLADDVVRLVQSILNRAEALGDLTDKNLLEVYSGLERGLLAPELIGDILFPIALRRLGMDTALQVSEGILIEPLTQEVQLARATSAGGNSDVNPFLVAAATHAIVLKSRKLDNTEGPLKRLLRYHYAPPGVAEAELVCEALSIVSGLDVGYAQVCIRPHGWADDTWRLALPAISNLATVLKYPLRLNERGWSVLHDPITADALDQLPAAFAALQSTDRRAQLASRRLAQTSRRERHDDVLIDACIGIEALLGQEHSELVHRMGLRASTALSAVGWKPRTAYDVVKKVYGYRSTIVHGGEPKKATIEIGSEVYSAHRTAVYLLRELLKAHLSSTPPWTPESLDGDLFGALEERQLALDGRAAYTSTEE